jgi:hypothetical protein
VRVVDVCVTVTKGIVAHYPIHHCKNSDHLAKNEDILYLQRELANDFQLTAAETEAELVKTLASAINQLIETNFSKLVMILYRLDISEIKLKETLRENPGLDAGNLVASLIVERQLQKLKSRQQSKPQQDIPDDEKW